MSFSALVAFNRSVVGVDAPIAQVFRGVEGDRRDSTRQGGRECVGIDRGGRREGE